MRGIGGLLGLLALAAATGCAGGGGSADGDCRLVVRFDGAEYEGMGVGVAPREGEPLGAGVLPGCDDGGGPAVDQEVELVAMEGVSTDLAVVSPIYDATVFVRQGSERPPEVEKLRQAPACDPRDESIDLAGEWLGILGADGHTELDLEPPYDVWLRVDGTSAARYERAFLTVRVPPAVGHPITRADVETSLWKGGSIALRVQCADEGRYVAQEVDASPPS